MSFFVFSHFAIATMGGIGMCGFWLTSFVLFLVADRLMSCYYSPACVGEQCDSHACSACPNCTDCLNIQYDCSRSNVKCNCIGITTCEHSRCESSASSLVTIFVNDSAPRMDVPMQLRKPSGVGEGITFVVGHYFDRSYELKDNCTEFPTIEFGTKSCSVQATYGCGHLSAQNPYGGCETCTAPIAAILDRSCIYNLMRIDDDEFLSGQLLFNGSFVSTEFDTHVHACDFDPDNDGFVPDFFVELKNRPGCLASLNIDGYHTFMVPVKLNGTDPDRASGSQG